MSVFSESQTPVGSEAEVATGSDQNYVDQLVGDGKKFQDVEALAKGKAEADKMIAELLEEKKGYAQQDYAKELLSKLEASAVVAPAPLPVIHDKGTEGTDQTGQSPEDIESLLNAVLNKREANTVSQGNLSAVNDALEKSFGTEAEAKVGEKAKELGMTKEAMQAIAAQSPKAFMTMMGEKIKTFEPIIEGSLNAPSSPSNVRNFDFYYKLYKSNPKQWRSASVQKQMTQDKAALGAKFDLR